MLSASSYGHFSSAKEFRSQCHIFRFGNIGFLRSLIFDDVFYTFLERPSPRNVDFPSRRVFTDPQGGARGEPPGSQGGARGEPPGTSGKVRSLYGRGLGRFVYVYLYILELIGVFIYLIYILHYVILYLRKVSNKTRTRSTARRGSADLFMFILASACI